MDRLSDDLATLLLDQQGGVDFDQEDDFDLVLVANAGEHVPVHSFLLKARSPFFCNLLASKPFLPSLSLCMQAVEVWMGKETLDKIITFLYTGKIEMDEVDVEILFEVLGNARLMGITDLEKEVKNHIILKLVQRSGYKDAALVFKVLNLATKYQLPGGEVVLQCLAFTHYYLNSEALQTSKTSWSMVSKDLHVLSPLSLATVLANLEAHPVAEIISLGLREEFWKGREESVFLKIGPEIKDEALNLLEVRDLLRILGHAGGQELGSRVTKVLVAMDKKHWEIRSQLEDELEVVKEEKEEEEMENEEVIQELQTTCEQFMTSDLEKDERIQDLGKELNFQRALNKAKDQKIQNLEEYLAHLEGAGNTLAWSSEDNVDNIFAKELQTIIFDSFIYQAVRKRT